ncbi:MAG TPA: hypothetical protein VH044_03235 [Polyangiaceae bacterium]|nr:hypothetical protein [Polyangiaceae bacterium]
MNIGVATGNGEFISGRGAGPEGHVLTCDSLRAQIAGLPQCCPQCHGRGLLQGVEMAGHPAELCCHLVTSVLGRLPGALLLPVDELM